ncbi:MAG: DUF490 domain-containing protein, partial [Candidatus Thiodiazotropha sp.]
MKPRLKRYLLRTLAGFGVLLALLLGVLVFLLYTETGARWSLALAHRMAPVEIGVGTLEGRQAGPLTLRQLTVKAGELHLSVEEIGLDWRPGALLHGELHLLDFRLQGMDLSLPAAAPQQRETPSKPFAGLRLPLAVTVDALQLDRVTIASPAMGEARTLDHLSLAVTGRSDRVEIGHLEAAALSAELKLEGSLTLTPTLPMALGLDWRYSLPDGPVLAGRGRIEGDLDRLQVKQQLDAPLAGRLQADLTQLMREPHWDAVIALTQAKLDTLLKGYPLAVKGELKSQGTPANIGLSADLHLTQPEYGQADLALDADFADGRLNARNLRLTTPSGVRIEGRGDYDTAVTPGRFSANLNWQDLRWPLQGEAVQFRSAQGKLGAEGSLDDYRYTLAMDAEAPGQPGGRLQSNGSG